MLLCYRNSRRHIARLILGAAASLASWFVLKSRCSDIKDRAVKRIVMAPKKTSKKGEEQPESDIISDTTAAGVIHNIKSWAIKS